MEEKKNTFGARLTDYAVAYATRDADPTTYTKALTALAIAVTSSVLKKCIDPQRKGTTPAESNSYSAALARVRADFYRAVAMATNADHAADHAATVVFDASGDPVTRIIDPDALHVLDTTAADTLGTGIDLAHAAIVAIMEETEKQVTRDPGKPVDLERPYKVRRLNQKVWIKETDTVNGWKTEETTPISEIYRAVRREIENEASIKVDPKNTYVYIDTISTDPDSEESATVYRRLNRFCDLGGYVTDFNGATTVYTVDNETVDRYDALLENLHLTKKQATVLMLRERGYGNRAIATYLGVTLRAVQKTQIAIQHKAIAAGITPEKITEAKK